MIEETVRKVLTQLDILDSREIGLDSDLFDAGMTSLSSVKFMLALENAFDVEFPDELLRPESFSSVGAVSSCVAEIMAAK